MRHHDEKETHGLRGVEADRLKYGFIFEAYLDDFRLHAPFSVHPNFLGDGVEGLLLGGGLGQDEIGEGGFIFMGSVLVEVWEEFPQGVVEAWRGLGFPF